MIVSVVLLAASAAAQTGASPLTIEEIFSVATPEELQECLVDGYPMPWLAEVLSDESIPEEDRYWLDCRMRAVIARELHTFYGRDGQPLHVDAQGGIRNGETYWREVFIVEPGFKEPTLWVADYTEPPYYFLRTPGYLLNRFGEKLGDIATTDLMIHLSRDGSVGVYTGHHAAHVQDPSCTFFLNSRNEVRKVVIGPALSGMRSIWMAEDGSIALAACTGPGITWSRNRGVASLGLDYPEREGIMLHVFTGVGDLLYGKLMPDGPTNVQISPDSRYIAYAAGESTYLLDASSGDILFTWERKGGCDPSFTRNSRYLCLPAVGGGAIYDCETGATMVELPSIPHPPFTYGGEFHLDLRANNNLTVIVGVMMNRNDTANIRYYHDVFLNDSLVSSEEIHGYRCQEVSPNGYFIDRENYSPFISNLWEGLAVPYTVLRVRGF